MSDDEEIRPGRVSAAWNSRPVFIGAVVVMALVVLVVALAVFTRVSTPTHAGQSVAAPTAAGTARAQAGGCSVPSGSMSLTPAIPQDLAWATGKDGLSWPVSASSGPTSTVDGFPACFARSPLGAALAASTAIYSQYDLHHSVQSALSFYIADSAGKATNISGTIRFYDPVALRNQGINPAGFIVDSFTKQQAQVTLVYSYASSPTGFTGVPCTVVWVNGDWKLSVLDNGELSSGSPTTPNAGDFTAWGGDGK